MTSPNRQVMTEHLFRDDQDGYWIDIHIDRQPYTSLGPFDSAAERQLAEDDLLDMMRSIGAVDLPPRMQ